MEGDEFVYRIPTNGVLPVKQAVGFDQRHQQHASFANGLPLPIFSTDTPDDEEQILNPSRADLAFEMW